MKARCGLAVLGLASVVACAAQPSSREGSSESDILNGSASDRREVVLLSNGSYGCSGTLIAPNVVLTAAHCSDYRTVVVGYSKRTTNDDERIGEPGPEDTWKKYRVAERVDIPGFANSGCPMIGAPDVALLRLTEPVADTPIATLADQAPELGQRCVVVGYGRHNADDNLATVEGSNFEWTYGERREARVTIFQKGGRGVLTIGGDVTEAGANEAGSEDAGSEDAGSDAGSEVGSDAGTVAASFDWFSAKGIDGAHSRGDSGGAIFCGGKLAGVVSCSADRQRAVLDLVKVYGNVETARSFIEETMRRWREAPLPPPDAGTTTDAGSADAAND